MTEKEIESLIYKIYLDSKITPEEFYKILQEINKRIYYMNINE